jgi:hydroxymethylpyrimidine/phosphomethylpyrimidine kinase
MAVSGTDWRVALTIAGSDSGGGAGIQADLKTFAAHGVFGMSAITALTAQNSQGVTRVEPVDPAMLSAQLLAVFADYRVDVVKIGMLGNAAGAEVVSRVLRSQARLPPVILDPVMVSSTGHRLLEDDAIQVVQKLLPLAALSTPNREEAAVFAGPEPVASWLAGSRASILVTGGDGPEKVEDHWWDHGILRRAWTGPRIGDRNFHGTGCTLASAIAARIARGDELDDAIDGAIRWVRALVAHAHTTGSVGGGHPSLAHHAVAPAP